MTHALIIEASRTPIGSYKGALSEFSASELAAASIFELIKRSGCRPDMIDEVILGHVLSAGCGQAPARQAALKAGLPDTTPCHSVNRVCSSGMTAVMAAADQIRLGRSKTIIAGGMESMSRVPLYLDRNAAEQKPDDGILKDGLRDAFDNTHMAHAAELCAQKYGLSRQMQDDYAIESYRRAILASDQGHFVDELIRMKSAGISKKIDVIERDEELKKFKPEKVAQLSPSFREDGTITAANASSVSDGAASLLLMDETFADTIGIRGKARILGYASCAQSPREFPTSPVKAIKAVLDLCRLPLSSIDLFEINEAFSAVALVNMKLLNLDPSIVNIHGGAVSIGHPLGCSGARILVTLLHALQLTEGRYGCAAICNGGGGASAIVIERINH